MRRLLRLALLTLTACRFWAREDDDGSWNSLHGQNRALRRRSKSKRNDPAIGARKLVHPAYRIWTCYVSLMSRQGCRDMSGVGFRAAADCRPRRLHQRNGWIRWAPLRAERGGSRAQRLRRGSPKRKRIRCSRKTSRGRNQRRVDERAHQLGRGARNSTYPPEKSVMTATLATILRET
jgi:hypothetical protein